MSDFVAAINHALAQPPGNQQLLEEAMRRFLSMTYQYYGPERAQLAHPAISDGPPWMGEHRILEHLAAGRWSTAYLALEDKNLYGTSLVVLGFASAPFEEVSALVRASPGFAKLLFTDRTGDAPQGLLALRSQLEDPNARDALLVAAVAEDPAVENSIELDPFRLGYLPPKLVQRALLAVGQDRTAALIERRLSALPTDDDRERASNLCTIGPMLGPAMSAATIDRVFDSFDSFGSHIAYRASDFGSFVAIHHPDLANLASLLAARIESRTDGAARAPWQRALHHVLGALAKARQPIDPRFDELADAALAAPVGGPERDAMNAYLWYIEPSRAEGILDRAWQRHASGVDHFALLRAQLSEPFVRRVAEKLVELREDKSVLDVLIILPLGALGSGFVAALQAALADVKPKKSFTSKLLKALSPTEAAALSHWLETRPEPKKAKKK